MAYGNLSDNDPYDDSGEFSGPSAEQLEDQVEALAELLRTVYEELGWADGQSDLTGQIEELFEQLELSL